MKAFEHERRDWVIIVLILLFGLFCMLLAGEWALRFTPHWELDTNMESNLDPNSDFLTRRPSGFIEPVDPAILTNPAWINVFLTPGASFATGTSFPLTTGTSFATPIITGTILATQTTTPITIASPTNTVAVTPPPTNAIVFFPPPSTSTPMPRPANTSTATSISTSVSISTTTPTSGPTSTSTSTSIVVSTSTPTSTSTSTSAATPTSEVSCTTTITITGTSGSYVKPGGATCFQYTDLTFVNGGIFQLTSTGVVGMVSGSGCPGKSIANGSTVDYGVEQSGGLMTFRITGLAGTVDINISDWTTYPSCP